MMEKTKKNTPAFRFPGFSEEWVQKRLIDLSEGGFNNGVFNDPRKVGKGYRLINVKDMYLGSVIDINSLTRVDIEENEFYKNKVEYGDILFTRSSIVKEGIAYSCVYLSDADDITYDGHLIRMRPYKNIASPSFLGYNFVTSQTRLQFIVRGKTTTMTTIGQEELATVEISLPTLPEQQKIASFFSAVDEKLQILTKKKTLLEQYKKGVMQKIFSQELRFKDVNGNEFPDWESKKLGEVTDLFSTRNNNLVEAEVYSVTNSKGFVLQTKHFEDRVIAGNDLSSYKILLKGDFAYNPARINVGSIAQFNNEIGIISSLYVCFRVTNILLDRFLIYFLQLNSTKDQISTMGEGGVRIYLWYPLFANIKINLPSIKEQAKITNFLSAIDEKITLCSTQIEKTELYKKGLLQKMFC